MKISPIHQTIAMPHVIIAAGLSAISYYLIMSAMLVGVLVLMLPALPLLILAFRFGVKAFNYSVGISVLFAFILTGIDGGVMYLTLLALPVNIFGKQILKAKMLSPQYLQWFPVGGALAALLLYMAGLIILLGIGLADSGGIVNFLVKTINVSQKTVEPELAKIVEDVVARYPYMILVSFSWFWVFMIYGVTVLAHAITDTFGRVLRPNVAIHAFLPPNWMLMVIAVSIMSQLSQIIDLQVVGAAVSLILLQLYFFVGLGAIHFAIHDWNNRKFWIGGFYVLLIIASQPVIIFIVIYGLIKHIKYFLQQNYT